MFECRIGGGVVGDAREDGLKCRLRTGLASGALFGTSEVRAAVAVACHAQVNAVECLLLDGGQVVGKHRVDGRPERICIVPSVFCIGTGECGDVGDLMTAAAVLRLPIGRTVVDALQYQQFLLPRLESLHDRTQHQVFAWVCGLPVVFAAVVAGAVVQASVRLVRDGAAMTEDGEKAFFRPTAATRPHRGSAPTAEARERQLLRRVEMLVDLSS